MTIIEEAEAEATHVKRLPKLDIPTAKKKFVQQLKLTSEEMLALNAEIKRLSQAYPKQTENFGAFYTTCQGIRNRADKYFQNHGVAPQTVTEYELDTGLFLYDVERNKKIQEERQARQSRAAGGSQDTLKRKPLKSRYSTKNE